jgi:hypothetical protein
MSKVFVVDEKWAEGLQTGVEEYMASLENFYVYGDEEAEEPEVLSGQPYCGCSTCYTREYFFYSAPILIQGFLDKKLEFDAS